VIRREGNENRRLKRFFADLFSVIRPTSSRLQASLILEGKTILARGGRIIRPPNGSMAVADFNVLVVDDDPAMLRLLSRWLQNAGYPTRTVADGQEALNAIERECPDFIVTDWDMPRINGMELCRLVREMVLPHYVYIVFLTVKSASAEMIAGLEIGADDFLSKPVSQAELLARMRSGSRVLKLERRLNLMAHTDSLTGLLTQRSFYESLAKEWHRSRRRQLPLSCVMMDIDFFKHVNDVHGHPAGDSVLKFVGELLVDNCRGSDSVCRYGGEEFCVMLPETNETDAAAWAERSRQRLAALRVPVGARNLHITGSFGAAQCRAETRDSEGIVDLADQALLCAKRAGRDRVVSYASLADASQQSPESLGHHDELFMGVCARDVMNPLVQCLDEDETIDAAAQFFLHSEVQSTPVLDAHGALVGFLSERDLMALMASPDCWQRPVHSAMRTKVISYEEDTPIRVIYEFLCRVSIRRVVITKNGHPTGTIGRNSLLRWFHNWVISKGLIHSPSAARVLSECSIEDMASAPCHRTPDNEPAIPSAE
jgi:two-component system, cell cycle response regulator